MSSYVRQIKAVARFDGDTIEATLKPLLYVDLLSLRGSNDDAASLAQYGAMLPRYVESMTPILDGEGGEVGLEVIGTAAFFMPLVAELLMVHIAAATPKNPPPPASQSAVN